MSHRPFEPNMTEDPDTMVLCEGGQHSQRLMKVRMLANLSDGYYLKDPACKWTNPKDGLRYSLFRWCANKQQTAK